MSAWAINQLARQERRDVDLLLDAGHRLLGAQQGLLAGEDRKSLDEARRTQRDALANLRQAARRILGEAGRGSEAILDRMMARSKQPLFQARAESCSREAGSRAMLRPKVSNCLRRSRRGRHQSRRPPNRDPLRGSAQLQVGLHQRIEIVAGITSHLHDRPDSTT